MDVLFVSPSALPYPIEASAPEASVALAKALRGLGHRVTIVAPYPEESDPGLSGMARRLDPLDVELGDRRASVVIHDGRSAAGIEWVLLEHESLRDLFETDASGLFAQGVLARAVALLLHRERVFDIVHFHGEETALGCAVLALEKRQKTLFSLYGLEAPVHFTRSEAEALGLDALVDDAGRLCPALSAVGCATRLVTSTPARLVSDSAGGELAAAVKSRGADVSAAGFALDGAIWNPVVDTHVFARFTPSDASGKQRNKSMLQKELGLELDPDVALLGAVESSLGAELLLGAAKELVRTDAQLVVQVMDEDAECLDALCALSDRMPHRLQVRVGDSQMRAHRIVGASDALVLASDRPVLAMAAQRYGALPVARRDSLSAETIVDIDSKLTSGSGILYDERSVPALLAGARRAIAAFNRGVPFERLRARMMRIDQSWERSARVLEHVYSQVVEVQAA